MHRVTWAAAAENHMMRIFAFTRRAIIAGGLEAWDTGSEIPAPGPLAKVAPDGAHVTQRGTSDGFTRLRERPEPGLYAFVRRDSRKGRRRTESKRTIVTPGDGPALRQPAEVDHRVRPNEPLTHGDEQIRTATERDRSISAQ